MWSQWGSENLDARVTNAFESGNHGRSSDYRDIATERHLTLIDHDPHESKSLKADPKQFFESVPRWDSSKRRGLHECHHAEHAPCFRNDLQTNRSKVVFSHSSFQTVIGVIQRRGLW